MGRSHTRRLAAERTHQREVVRVRKKRDVGAYVPANKGRGGLLSAPNKLGEFLLGERPGRYQLGGCALLALGLVALAYDGLAAGGRLTWLGDLLFALAGCSWGVFTFLLRR